MSWHALRPWSPPLALAVREVTSVSATFILASALDLHRDNDSPALAAALADDDPEARQLPRKTTVVADALAKGLSVNVNGASWPRAFIRIDDQLDEAIIIIYALMPGRQYDIDLALATPGHSSNVLRTQVFTDDDSDRCDSEDQTDPDSVSPDNSTSDDPHSSPTTSPSRTAPGTPQVGSSAPSVAAADDASSPSEPISLEERLGQLRQTLAQVNTERESLLVSLKTARRDAQKTDSALRSEIETLKRGSEKHTVAEQRNKQKILALQQTVKHAHTATEEIEEATKAVEAEIPILIRQKEEKQREFAKLKDEAARVRKERTQIEEQEKKCIDSMTSELTTITHKIEKLSGKREKLETSTIPDLEEKLREVQKEIEEEEAAIEESMRMTYLGYHQFPGTHMPPQLPHSTPLLPEHSILDPHDVPIPRPRYQSGEKPPPPIARPNLGPIARPPGPGSATTSPTWSPVLPRGAATHQPPLPGAGPGHTLRSQSFHMGSNSGNTSNSTSTPVGPQRRGSLMSSTSPSSPSPPNANPVGLTSSPTSYHTNNSSQTSIPSVSSSTLSSRAQPFEPSRSIKNALAAPGSLGGMPIGTVHGVQTQGQPISPIQRPGRRSGSLSGKGPSVSNTVGSRQVDSNGYAA